MREIKFRAWDADLEYMVYSDKPEDDFFFEFGTDGKFRAFGIDYNGDPGDLHTPPGPLSYELLSIMQYTGLKDKNGKEIYEGDIVKFRMDFQGTEYNDWEDVFFSDYTGEVVITASKGVCLKCPMVVHINEEGKHSKPSKLECYRTMSECRSEIIGNIYENPGLLDSPTSLQQQKDSAING